MARLGLWFGASGGPTVNPAAHEVSCPVAADQDPFAGQIAHHLAAAATGILQVEGVNLGHDPQRRFTHRHRPVIEPGPGQAQQRTLAAYAELGIVVIDQLAQFTGIRVAETFFERLQVHLQLPVAVRLVRSSTAGTALLPWPGSRLCPCPCLLG